MSPDTPTPAEEKAETTPAPKPELTPEAAAPATAPEAPATDKPEAPAEAKAPAADSPAEDKAGAPAPAPEKPRKRGGAILDISLVLVLIGILVAAAYYVHDTMTRYHVPTPLELAMEENQRLSARYEQLFPQANIADEQIHLRERLTQLEGQLSRLSRMKNDKLDSIDEHHGRVLALQYSIRQTDATNRSIARSLLTGMHVGDVRTTDEKLYRNATIRSIDFREKRIALRYPQGQVRFPLRKLVKESLPDLARYALNDIELVDMSDFERSENEPEVKPAKPRPTVKPKKPAVVVTEEDYEPSGAPILDTEANRTATTRVTDEATPPAQDVWDAPTGDLPM